VVLSGGGFTTPVARASPFGGLGWHDRRVVPLDAGALELLQGAPVATPPLPGPRFRDEQNDRAATLRLSPFQVRGG
jgi:hypothetical protein